MKKLKENLLTVNMIPIDPPIAGPRALELKFTVNFFFFKTLSKNLDII